MAHPPYRFLAAAPPNRSSVIGVDLGIKQLATIAEGTVEPNPRQMRSSLKQLQRLQRAVSRRHKGSHNRTKAVCELA